MGTLINVLCRIPTNLAWWGFLPGVGVSQERVNCLTLLLENAASYQLLLAYSTDSQTKKLGTLR